MNVSRVLATKGRGVITIGPNQTVREAIARLSEHNIGVLVVIDEAGLPIGIISERDVIHYMVKDETILAHAVHQYMTRNLITAVPQDELVSVAHTMTEKRIRHLPVVEGEMLIGIISIGDVVKAQRDAYRGEIDTLETQIIED